MISLEDLARIAEIEFSDIVDTTEMMGTKLRIMLTDGSFVDVWLSKKLAVALVSIGNIELLASSIVTIIFLTRIGGIFPLSHIISIMALKIM